MDFLLLNPNKVLQGEIWRLFTFVIMPPFHTPHFLFFALYLIFIDGEVAGKLFGNFRNTIFLADCLYRHVLVSFLTPSYSATNLFLGCSVFLALPPLNPNFELAIFFILPGENKWWHYLTWIGYFFQIEFGFAVHTLYVLRLFCNYPEIFSGILCCACVRSLAHGTCSAGILPPKRSYSSLRYLRHYRLR